MSVRGFPEYVAAAKKILETQSNVYFLAIGDNSPTALDSDHWIQLSFTESPADYINACDAVVCPNEHALFDLIMLEVFSLGKPLVASFVGGYKTVKNYTDGIIYSIPKDYESLTEALRHFISLPKETKKKLMGEHNLKLYRQRYDLQYFNRRYSNFVDSLYASFDRDFYSPMPHTLQTLVASAVESQDAITQVLRKFARNIVGNFRHI